MDCSEVKPLIRDYAQGKLAPRKVEEVEEHLRQCNSCRTYWEAFQREVLPFLGAKIYPIPEGEKALMRRQRMGQRKGTKWGKEHWLIRILPNLLTAISLLLIIIGLVIAQRRLTGR